MLGNLKQKVPLGRDGLGVLANHFLAGQKLLLLGLQLLGLASVVALEEVVAGELADGDHGAIVEADLRVFRHEVSVCADIIGAVVLLVVFSVCLRIVGAGLVARLPIRIGLVVLIVMAEVRS